MELRTTRCVVRDYQPTDALSLATHGNSREVWLNLRDRFPHPFREADAAWYISAVRAETTPTSFAIVIDDEAVGGISLRPGSDIERLTAEVGFWLGETFWGRGIVTDAVGAVTTWGFEELGLARIFAVPFARNHASHRVLEKSGYEREGLLRSSAIKDGQILDQYMYARVKQ
jgi:ribosomal-protein-alanine N-acetyltransferase